MFNLTPREKIILVATVIVMIPIVIVIGQNLSYAFTVGGKIRNLNSEAEQYQKSIEKDSLLLERIKFDEGLEEYARENYYMQRRGERVFILEK